ncbi:S8 family serine peptidase [Chitinophaga arvensicola]|uniref:Por secretion system C-terminal sorting domain-containing protein n=1 Tax=Chitinophaga arvensicola TaxID=29529 RepID=A0A1I0RE86_9BACT|nr:S8 family serine peptidase [Chitinophaga arvensicola]SEW38920.1 Por secretion system C-terminal sorting domain-containing protein [Chitinophaga arvensicola]
MKKTLLLALLIGSGLHLCAQNDYYWSSGKKIPLKTDSTTVIIKTATTAELKSAAARFKSLAQPGVAVDHADSQQLVIKYHRKVALKEVTADLAAATGKKTEARYAHTALQSPFILTGNILYEPADGKTPQDVLNFLGKQAITRQYEDRYKTVHVTAAHLDSVLAIANRLYESGLVKWCHPDFFSDFKPSTNDPLYNNQYYLDNYGQTGGTANIDIDANVAFNNLPANAANNVIRVAVIDDGVDAHEELGTRLVAGFTAGGFGTGAQSSTTQAHGQACAGIIGATRDNNIGIAGLCSNCQIVPVNIFNGFNGAAASAGDIAGSINWAWTATQGNADVLSCSWGGGLPADAITQAITAARTQGRGNRGAVVVFAAGNFQNGSASSVAYPANVSGVISVGAINKSGARWYYSPNSPSIVAPTGDVNGNGDVYTLDRMGTNGGNAGNYVTNFGGTSAACPQVAGVAALILSVSPHLTEAQVKTAILTSATPMNNSTNFGAGRLNAYNAIQKSLPYIIGPDAFCTTTANYTVGNAPPNATYAWTVSNTNYASVTPSSATATVTRFSQGYTPLNVTINGIYQAGKSLVLGSNSSIEVRQAGTCYDGRLTWELIATPSSSSASNWQWAADPNASGEFYISSPNSSSTFVTVKGGGYVNVTYTDACGQTSMSNGGLVYSPCPSSLMANVTVYPNPVSSQLFIKNGVVTPAVNAKVAAAAPDNTLEAKLYNEKGWLIRSSKIKESDATITFDTGNLPEGTYYLHLYQGGQRTERQIVIRH